MKKNYLLCTTLALMISSVSFSQVVNGNFEDIKSNFLPANWGMNFVQQVGFDPETGESLGDDIQYTWCIPSMVYASFEPQSGNYAMEISNAFNLTQNVVIPGTATIFSDPEQDSPGWNPGIPVEATDNISMIGFYYKFLPAGDDEAQARISVSDSNGNEIGHATINITEATNDFQYVYQPISYTSSATPASIIISFTMAREGSTPTFGSRLIVDNVVTNFDALQVDDNEFDSKIAVYPTLTENELNVDTKGLTQGEVNYKVMNIEGKVVKQNTVSEDSGYIYSMDVSQLSSGIYFLKINSSLGQITKKFIKK
ncbi:T9SS type A sorting domain-containing protein [Flavobacterium silvisoli]|uniref:T9SS type A sorting domain-containing protein n=1 Tax=Flavobacterium silvisoli TaxID=2529433 RepID=A0A4Q9YNZ0_9FLAO|nr:T9SS type A sorting domain-containing protein [Flavobacterium silvisoli]TBX64969.1 T9SS type A sorting domain-containing protein [Flavobacterium silvisoli]